MSTKLNKYTLSPYPDFLYKYPSIPNYNSEYSEPITDVLRLHIAAAQHIFAKAAQPQVSIIRNHSCNKATILPFYRFLPATAVTEYITIILRGLHYT
jgi:hypothetical protein